MAKIKLSYKQVQVFVSHFYKDLWPVLVLLVGCHQQIGSKNRHQAVPLRFKVDRSISTQEAAQSLRQESDRWKVKFQHSL